MQVNQLKFVDMMIQITAAQEFAHRCIRKMVRDEDATLDISMAKVFCATMKQYVATTCVQLFGGAATSGRTRPPAPSSTRAWPPSAAAPTR